MLRACNWMAGGLAVTGALAYPAADSGRCLSPASTPPISVIMRAPLGFVLVC
jgi:uncharacterized protein